MDKRKPKILVVEDVQILMSAWISKFKNQGFEVCLASNGKAAVKAAVEEHPDLVVLDLANSEGEEVIKKLREYKWANNMPVMFLNSWDDEEIISAYSEGIDDHLAYNWSLEEVVQKAKQKLAVA